MIYDFLPELNYHFTRYWNDNAEIANEYVPISSDISENDSQIFTFGTFIDLLFSNTYSYENYLYLFEEIDIYRFSKPIRERINCSSSQIKCYVMANEGTLNTCNLQQYDIFLLDELLKFRLDEGEEINLQLYNFNNLTRLSKLIYIYLDAQVNNNISKMNSEFILSSNDNLLENLFELYVINESHKIVSNMSTIIDSSIVELRPCHEKTIITPSHLSSNRLQLKEQNFDFDIFVYWNGILLTNEEHYDIIQEFSPQITYVSWDGKGLDIQEGDVFIIEYYTSVIPGDVGTQPSDLKIDDYNESLQWILDGGSY